jgi:hypothetical protein
MDNLMLGFILLLIGSFISLYLMEKANKKLDQEKKASLVGLFSRHRIHNLGFIIIIITLLYTNSRFHFIEDLLAITLYIIILVSFIIFSNYRSYSILKSNDFPAEYIQSYLIAMSVRFVGLIVFFILMFS